MRSRQLLVVHYSSVVENEEACEGWRGRVEEMRGRYGMVWYGMEGGGYVRSFHLNFCFLNH